jgi:hypothetical protein
MNDLPATKFHHGIALTDLPLAQLVETFKTAPPGASAPSGAVLRYPQTAGLPHYTRQRACEARFGKRTDLNENGSYHHHATDQA